MSSPAASVSLAVLVLAWDETTPAARVVVEAPEVSTSYADSVVALLPLGPLTDALSQEEFLPLEPSPTPSELPAETGDAAGSGAAATATAEDVPAVFLAPEHSQPSALPTLGDTPAVSHTAPTPLATAPVDEALVKPALIWQEVRVLHFDKHPSDYAAATLAHYSGPAQPVLPWAAAPGVPAAPYLGSSEPLPVALSVAAQDSAVAAALLAATDTAATALVALRTPGPPAAEVTLPTSEESTLAPPAYLLAELPAAPDAEPDALPTPAAEPALLTAASSTEWSEEAAAPGEPFAGAITPVQTEEPTAAPALASAPLAMAEPAPGEAPELKALHPAAQSFDAPNLNFQIIQYARLAVPQALAEQPFGVIYAPAWPTWLAAQELRHRSGQPLVLHLAELAATDDERIDLAAGWPAEIQRQALHRADLILTETPALAQRLRRELALPAHRVRCVPAADAMAVAQALRSAGRG
jgi:hypothetical protein